MPAPSRRRLALGAALPAAAAALAFAAPADAAVTSTFSQQSGVLSVFGDNGDNQLVVGRDAGGRIHVNGGAVTVLGGVPTVANVQTISVFGLGGDDELRIDETGGAMPRAQLFGGAADEPATRRAHDAAPSQVWGLRSQHQPSCGRPR